MNLANDGWAKDDFLERARGLGTFFSPRSIAVIGASPGRTRLGGRVIDHLTKAAYPGAIYPVNPRYTDIAGLPCYPDVQALPQPADLAVVAIPAEHVANVTESCAAAGIRSLLVFSGGFAEIGDLGRKRQDDLRAVVQRTGVRLLGPNCLGAVHTASRLMATFTAVDVAALHHGNVGLVTQSGLVGTYLLRLAQRRQLGFSTWIATGNEIDIGAPECLARLALDDETRVIAVFIEAIRHGGQLCAAFETAMNQAKPVVVLKTGRSELGRRVTTSHTAGMAGSDDVFDSVCERYGVHRVHDLHEMLDVAEALVRTPTPAGNRLCAVTISGGFGALIADEAADAGLTLPDVPDDVRAEFLRGAPYLPVMNPVDIADQLIRDPGALVTYVKRLLATERYDAFLTFLGQVAEDPEVIERYVTAMQGNTLPLFMSGVTTTELENRLRQAGIPLYENPTDAVRTIGALVRHATASKAAATTHQLTHTPPWPPERIEAARQRVTTELGQPPPADRTTHRHPLSEGASRELLQIIGIPVVTAAIAHDTTSLTQQAAKIGYPVVLKVNSPDLPHKSDLGAVTIGIHDERSLLEAHATMTARLARERPDATLQGFLVARQERPGLEAIAGISRDPSFGPVVMVGTGGTATEAIADYQLALCPITPTQARQLIAKTRLGRVIQHPRMHGQYDLDGLADLVAKLSHWATLEPRLLEIDLNPVLVSTPARGVTALDAHIVLGQPNPD